jgi:hypothetical protein
MQREPILAAPSSQLNGSAKITSAASAASKNLALGVPRCLHHTVNYRWTLATTGERSTANV